MENWTTAGTVHGDPFESWKDDLAAAFVRLDPRRVGCSPFFGHIMQARSGAIRLSEVRASAHGVSRRPEHIGASAGDIVFVNLQIAGRGLTHQHERDITTLPGDIAIADTVYPFEILHAGDFALYSIAVPRQDLPVGLLRRGALRLSSGERGRQISRMMAGYARLLLSSSESSEYKPLYGKHIVDLIQLGMEQSAGVEDRGPLRLPLLLDHLSQNHADKSLSAEKAARLFGVSPRYIHKLLEQSGSSFLEHLKGIRLEAAAQALCLRATDPVTEIALDSGFSDLSHFNRCFKRRFGECPTDYRRRMSAH